MAQSQLTAASTSQVQVILLPPLQDKATASRVAGTTVACHHAWLIFVLSVEMGFYHIGQAVLELLTLIPRTSVLIHYTISS